MTCTDATCSSNYDVNDLIGFLNSEWCADCVELHNEQEAARVAAIAAEQAKAEAAKCGRCRGTGHLSHYQHIANGVCFDCGGFGVREPAPEVGAI